MTHEERVALFAQEVGGDVKIILVKIGDLTSLSTTAKTSLVAALNELKANLDTVAASGGAIIDDTKGNGDTGFVWSADKTFDAIALAKSELKTELLGGASAAYDTLLEIEAKLGGQDTSLANLLAAVNQTVRTTADQGLSSTLQANARANIAAASKAEHDALAAAVGNTDRDYVAAYNAAKA